MQVEDRSRDRSATYGVKRKVFFPSAPSVSRFEWATVARLTCGGACGKIHSGWWNGLITVVRRAMPRLGKQCMPVRFHITSEWGDRDVTCGELVTIGRSEKNDVTLNHSTVSRSHVLLRRLGDGKYYVMDMGSMNGTFVNDKRVVVPAALNEGDTIRIGGFTLHVHLIEEPSEEAADLDSSDGESTMYANDHMLRELTILVVDVRDYTPMSEEIPAVLLASVMGSWFRSANEVVARNAGVVDKFIGDAVMVRWMTGDGGLTTKDCVMAALRTALEIEQASEAVNTEFPELPKPLRVGAGINTGRAILGNVGANSRRDYTALGDAVNAAFRFEKATKTLKRDLVAGPKSYKHFRSVIDESCLREVTVKGKGKPIPVCALTYEELARILAREAD